MSGRNEFAIRKAETFRDMALNGSRTHYMTIDRETGAYDFHPLPPFVARVFAVEMEIEAADRDYDLFAAGVAIVADMSANPFLGRPR